MRLPQLAVPLIALVAMTLAGCAGDGSNALLAGTTSGVSTGASPASGDGTAASTTPAAVAYGGASPSPAALFQPFAPDGTPDRPLPR